MCKSSWLCKMIGHKWLTCQRGHKDGKRVVRQTIWPACLRCGEPAPDALVDGCEDLSDAMANEAAHAARGLESVESYRRRMMRSCAEGLGARPEYVRPAKKTFRFVKDGHGTPIENEAWSFDQQRWIPTDKEADSGEA